MPLKAIHNSKTIYAWNYNGEKPIFCPYCNREFTFVDAKLKIKHFRHKTSCPFTHEPETEDHERMKVRFYDFLSRWGQADVEVRIGKHIADVVAKSLKWKIAVEVQASNLSFEQGLDRIKEYTNHGYYTLFVFHSKFITWRRRFVVLSKFRRLCIYYYDRYLHFFDPNIEMLGLYRLRKKINEDERLEGYRYLVEEKVWAPLSDFRLRFRSKDGLLVAGLQLNKS